ncbi:helix-turn-helix domain-containing protein [Ornithinimicrobium sp. CNJ-824]|uniref:helix-turn-helix domain-containing protein n=1 Tax=Ornithinimicrobium sp. CNJ-824 TaxID=1904966 RepID=UPI00095C652C|nr:helix-turn-helix domain-containing protein [Ornithinimicrobium sp. CNJ-824]OLT21406.1 helix-turn-helix domain-containing protein [Ornithinimicrobium sp. CNJ-824]
MSEDTDLMTLPQVAELLQRPPATLRWLRSKGEGPRSAVIAGRITYRRRDVLDWIDAQFAADDSRPVRQAASA